MGFHSEHFTGIRPGNLRFSLHFLGVWLTMAAMLLEVQQVGLNFGGVQALTDVSFSVSQGELFSIIGPNGAGKTTLFDCISGRYTPKGSIKFNGVELVGQKSHLRPKLGIMRTFQNIALFPNETVEDNVLVGSDYRLRSGLLRSCLYWSPLGCSRQEGSHRAQAREIMAELGVEQFANVPASELAYGTQKRVELARALVAQPALLLLDEPMAGMTSGEKMEIAALVQKLNQERGITVVMIEHDMGVVMEISHRVLVLDFGQRIALGPPLEVIEDPQVRRAYLGEAV